MGEPCSSSNGQTATLEEFEKVLAAMKLESLVPLAPRIFKLFDFNHDGCIDLREVICGFTALLRSEREDVIRLCFKVNHCNTPRISPLLLRSIFLTVAFFFGVCV